MHRYTFLIVVASFLFLGSRAQHGPLTADEIMQEAMQQAAKEKKNIFIIFHASWCGWCHKMDSSMDEESCRKFFDDNYVIRHLVVDESRDKKNLENPGANEFRAKYNGDNQGIPFWLIFDKNGVLIADSQMRPAGAGLDTRGANLGCPATEQDVTQFVEILKKTAHPTKSQLRAIEKRFRMNEQ
jgi:hypothetical protein